MDFRDSLRALGHTHISKLPKLGRLYTQVSLEYGCATYAKPSYCRLYLLAAHTQQHFSHHYWRRLISTGYSYYYFDIMLLIDEWWENCIELSLFWFSTQMTHKSSYICILLDYRHISISELSRRPFRVGQHKFLLAYLHWTSWETAIIWSTTAWAWVTTMLKNTIANTSHASLHSIRSLFHCIEQKWTAASLPGYFWCFERTPLLSSSLSAYVVRAAFNIDNLHSTHFID